MTSLLTHGAGVYRYWLKSWIPASVPSDQGVRLGGTGVTAVNTYSSLRDQWATITNTFTWDGVGTVSLQGARSGADNANNEQWWDAIIVTPGSAIVPYFSGDTPDTEFDIYEWLGTPGNSVSRWTHIDPFVGDSCVPDESGCLTLPPDGLGLPPMRTEDITYPQVDGVRHFADWYESRIVTLENVIIGPSGCSSCPSVRERVQAITRAWGRQCDDVELVIFTDCHGTEPPTGGTGAVTGPYGLVGRPRVAEVEWLPGRSKAARMTLRFDAVDHRMFLLDACGTPGSGEECVTLTPDVSNMCRSYNRCYTTDCGSSGVSGWTYTTTSGATGTGPQEAIVIGTVCANPIIATLEGSLTDPFIENVETGEIIGYSGTIEDDDDPVIIDTAAGTATQGGQSRTHLLTGNPRFRLEPGTNTLRLTAFGATDDGAVSVCWRPAVESG